ncbi:hypothetical protein BGZ65_005943 [Modicella reniformis]|uniref:Uncharacterized protein n=1 Tax=Modicella reniformis TaxID=1440133 RepID=A0A9P6M8J4_9FUNG|nr:hypothetical protein BGZ65_005943 [Modicella reniformis]
MNSRPLSRRTTTEPPPLHTKGSTSSIITGILVNNGKHKDSSYSVDSSTLDYSPTPAEALAIEAAAKQQTLQEQRQQQEQNRKLLKKQQKHQEEAEQQAELLNQKLKKQNQEQEREQHELQKQRLHQEIEQKLQAQMEKEQRWKEQMERETQEKKERELHEEQARNEKEKMARMKKEGREQWIWEEQEREEQRRKQMGSIFVSTPTLALGSFSFNPDASLTTQPPAFSSGSGLLSLGSETPGPFGLDTFSTFSNLSITPGHYTGTFNPFSMDDEPLMRRSAPAQARSFLDDADYNLITGGNRPVGPPIPGKPRQTSRFGFALDNQYDDSLGVEGYSNTQAMQDGFRTLFPNVNAGFISPNGSLNSQQQQQQQPLQHQPLQQLQQHSQQHHITSSPLFSRHDAVSTSGWDINDKQDLQMLQRSMGQLNMDPALTTPSSRMAEYHQQLQIQQQHSQRNGPPGITRSSLTAVKSPPPGLESVVRTDIGNWQRQQQQQQQQQQSSRMNGWSSDNNMHFTNNTGSGVNQENTQEFFGAFLKASATTSQNQPSTFSSGNQAHPGPVAFQDPAIMSVRMSAAGSVRASLVEALQTPSPSGYRTTTSQDSSRTTNNDSVPDRISSAAMKESSEGGQQQGHSLKLNNLYGSAGYDMCDQIQYL